jgi:hypothetical protein
MPQGQTTILNDGQNRRFAALSAKTHKSVQELIEQALDEFLDRNAPEKSAQQIRAEQDAEIIKLIRDSAREKGVDSAGVRHDFATLKPEQLKKRYGYPIETVKDIQDYIARTNT